VTRTSDGGGVEEVSVRWRISRTFVICADRSDLYRRRRCQIVRMPEGWETHPDRACVISS
jgi:hypothetical protein